MIRLNLQQKTEQKICIALATVLLGMFISYIYLVSASIVHVVIRTELNQEIQQVSSEISLLESEYIAAQHQVSQSIASLQGYTENSRKIFIDRSAPSLVYSGDTNR
tara:strand:+ start:271 stop:588 length:318 start_codon:yes stop_codon:yes gene_type:complete